MLTKCGEVVGETAAAKWGPHDSMSYVCLGQQHVDACDRGVSTIVDLRMYVCIYGKLTYLFLPETTCMYIYICAHTCIYMYTYRQLHVSTCIHVCGYVYTHTSICIYIYTHVLYIYIHTYTYRHRICIHVYIYIYTYMHACIHTYIHTYVHIHTHTCIYTYIYIYASIHAHTLRAAARIHICNVLRSVHMYFGISQNLFLCLVQDLKARRWDFLRPEPHLPQHSSRRDFSAWCHGGQG